MPQTMFVQLMAWVSSLINQNIGVFIVVGLNLWRGFALIDVVLMGKRTAQIKTLDIWMVVDMLLLFSFSWFMLAYYAQPSAILGGLSFHQLIPEQAQWLANRIGQAMLENLMNRVAAFQLALQSPRLTNVLGMIYYVITILETSALSGVAFLVIAGSLVVEGILALVGPLSIPFLICPHLEFLFWNWLKAQLAISMYRVVAAAMVFVVSNMMSFVLNIWQPIGQGVSIVKLVGIFGASWITFVVGIGLIFCIPLVAVYWISGYGGGLSGAGILATIGKAA
jgi:TrbL/VirB6 plasmid conjugal transfer protein